MRVNSLIAAFVSGEASSVARRARRAAIVYLFAAVTAVAGICFLVGAGYLAAARSFGAIESAIGFGVGFLLIALLALGIHALASRTRARRAADRRAADIATIAGVAAVSLLPSLLRSKGGIAGILGPALAVLAYAIYRENVKQDGSDKPPE